MKGSMIDLHPPLPTTKRNVQVGREWGQRAKGLPGFSESSPWWRRGTALILRFLSCSPSRAHVWSTYSRSLAFPLHIIPAPLLPYRTPRVLPSPQADKSWEIPSPLSGRHGSVSDSPGQEGIAIQTFVQGHPVPGRAEQCQQLPLLFQVVAPLMEPTESIMLKPLHFHRVIHAETNSCAV